MRTKCYFCKKHIRFWQSETFGYHTDCYRLHLLGLIANPTDGMERIWALTPEPECSQAKAEHRAMVLRELSELNRAIPGLNLGAAITKARLDTRV